MSDQRRDKMLEELVLLIPQVGVHTSYVSQVLREDLMDWALRWSGRPKREQLEYLLKEYQGNIYHYKVGRVEPSEANPDLINAILALYPSPPPERTKVTREEIRKKVYGWFCANVQQGKPWGELVGDLCKLIGVEEEKPATEDVGRIGPGQMSYIHQHKICISCGHCMGCNSCNAPQPE